MRVDTWEVTRKNGLVVKKNGEVYSKPAFISDTDFAASEYERFASYAPPGFHLWEVLHNYYRNGAPDEYHIEL